LGGNGNDTFAFDAAGATSASNPSPANNPDFIFDFDLAGDDRLDLGAAGHPLHFRNTRRSAGARAGPPADTAPHTDGAVIQVTRNLGPADNTIVFWDTNADGTPDEAIALSGTPQTLVQADDII